MNGGGAKSSSGRPAPIKSAPEPADACLMPDVESLSFWIILGIGFMLVLACLRVIAAAIENARARHQLMLDVRTLQMQQVNQMQALRAEREERARASMERGASTAAKMKKYQARSSGTEVKVDPRMAVESEAETEAETEAPTMAEAA